MNQTADFLIIGGGVIGLCMAIEVKRRYPGNVVTIIEKEKQIGLHASGRNSGVLHAGFYYTADSLKAKFTRDGNRELTNYCEERGLKINKCGKLVVAENSAHLAGLGELLNRGRLNGVELIEVTDAEARKIEPRVKTYERALFSPHTSSVDPSEIMSALLSDAISSGVNVEPDTAYHGLKQSNVVTNRGQYNVGYVINSAGLYADKIARDFGFSKNYKILPFKGLYLYSNESPGSFRTHIYPVPDLRNPFLGVHFTVSVNGGVKIGPTAIPAFWREHYRGIANFKIRELLEIAKVELELFWRNESGFRSLAFNELMKQSRTKMVSQASMLATNVFVEDYPKWGRPGIRAQLYDVANHKLEMDFKYEGDNKSFHVLNAVSPAFTCSLPFTRFLTDKIEHYLSKGMN